MSTRKGSAAERPREERAPSERPTALVFRRRILPWSETFIAAQSGAMTRYAPILIGYSRDASGAANVAGRPQLLLEDHSAFPAVEKFLLKAAGRAPRRWLRAIADTRPTILHAHFGSSALPASGVSRSLGIPLVVTYHGMDVTVPPRNAAGVERRRRGFAAAERVIAVSEFIADAARRAGCPDAKLTVHYIGVDTARFTPGSAPRSPTEILFVGRLAEKKGVVHLIRALAEVRHRFPEATLVVAGDGPLREELEREAARLGVPTRWLGVQTPDQVRALMQGAALLCGPSIADSRGNAEGLPITFLEAQACGAPVIVSRSGGSAEGVREGESGFVFDPGDEAALAGHLATLLGDPELRRRMGAAARRHVVERFDLARQTARLEEIYNEVRAGLR